jgi:hypothetical protein
MNNNYKVLKTWFLQFMDYDYHGEPVSLDFVKKILNDVQLYIIKKEYL